MKTGGPIWRWKKPPAFSRQGLRRFFSISLFVFLSISIVGCTQDITERNLAFQKKYYESQEEKAKKWEKIYFACFTNESKNKRVTRTIFKILSFPGEPFAYLFGKNQNVWTQISQAINVKIEASGSLDKNLEFDFEDKCQKLWCECDCLR